MSQPKQVDFRVLAVAGIGILLVVVGHSTGVVPARQRELEAVNALYAAFTALISWIYLFHMPLFFALSGYNMFRFTRSKPSRTFANFVGDRAYRLLAPYIIISSMAYPFKVALARLSIHPVTWSVTGYLHTLFWPWDNTIIFFWFLPTLFIAQLLCWYLVSPRRSMGLAVGVVLVCALGYFYFPHQPRHGVLAFLNLGGVAHNMIFLVAGALVAKHSIALPRRKLLVALGGLALTILARCFPGLAPLNFLAAFGGIVMVVVVGAVLSQPSGPLARLGAYSFQIYLLSWFPQIGTRILLGQILHANIWLNIVMCIVSGLVIPIGVIRALNVMVPPRYRFTYGL